MSQVAAAIMTMNAVTAALRGWRFDLSDEKRLQAEMSGALRLRLAARGMTIEREVRLSASSVIDLTVATPETPPLVIGIEVKTRTRAKAAVRRQCCRYLASGRIDGLLLVSATAIALPPEIDGRPVRTFSLGEAWM
jgi:hypothetical protein